MPAAFPHQISLSGWGNVGAENSLLKCLITYNLLKTYPHYS